MKHIPDWIKGLETEELNFIKKFVLASGSLKEIAKQYDVTYPTVRLRLDKIIEKIHLNDKEEDPYIRLIKTLTLEKKIQYDAAKVLIETYRREK